jgi:hypothetical protein
MARQGMIANHINETPQAIFLIFPRDSPAGK